MKMNNYEYYKEEIENNLQDSDSFCKFVQNHIMGTTGCGKINCTKCRILAMEWAQKEHEINWDEVPVNTPVLVSDIPDGGWNIRNFAMHLPNGTFNFYVFGDGANKENARVLASFKYCKLIPDDDIYYKMTKKGGIKNEKD